MSPDRRSANWSAAHEQPLLSLAYLIATIIGAIFLFSCSAISGTIPTTGYHAQRLSAGPPQSEDVDTDELRSLAIKGDAEAQYQLANRYATQYGATGDYVKASYWWHLAAQQGLAKAQYALGILYANGRGVNTDYTRAVHWYRQAAHQELAVAEYNLGMHYWLGQGVPRDNASAVKWLHKAAEQGLPQAQYNLGLLLERGLGAPRNLQEARKWYARAAAQGLPAAQREMQAPPTTLPRRPSLP